MKKSELSTIMQEAWQLVRTYALSMSEALKRAWTLFKLVQKMKKGIAMFRYEKINGEIRQAWGTLAEAMLPAFESNNTRARSPFVQTYFDVERHEFRSFKKINLIA